MYLPNPSANRIGCNTKSISKRSKAALNSELSFSKTGYLTKAKESVHLTSREKEDKYLSHGH